MNVQLLGDSGFFGLAISCTSVNKKRDVSRKSRRTFASVFVGAGMTLRFAADAESAARLLCTATIRSMEASDRRGVPSGDAAGRSDERSAGGGVLLAGHGDGGSARVTGVGFPPKVQFKSQRP